jgi:hypothetical protein
MSTIAVFLKVDGERVVESLREAQLKLDGSSEAVLDFESVSRLQPRDLSAMEELVKLAEGHGLRIELRGVNIAIYKVLKLARLAPRFGFRV